MAKKETVNDSAKLQKKKQSRNSTDDGTSMFDEGFDLDGLDDLNVDELGGDALDDNRKPSRVGTAKRLAKDAGTGFLDSLVKNTAKKTLPEEYTHNFHEVMDFADITKTTFVENKNVIERSLFRFGEEVSKVLPFQSKILEKFLEKYRSDFETHKQVSEEQMRETSIQSEIGNIFDKQLDVQQALEARRSAEDQIEKKERIVNNKLNLDLFTSIDKNISNLTAFTLQINKEYFRKSLELQFKTYFIQADMLKTTKDSFKAFSVQFDSIVKNTGLPEFVKLNNAERVGEVIRTQFIQNTYKNVFDNSDYLAGIKKRFSGLIGEKVSGITEKIDSITEQLSMLNSSDQDASGKIEMITGALASLGGSTLGEKAAGLVPESFREKVRSNKYVKSGANYLATLASSPETLFKSARDSVARRKEEHEGGEGPGSFFLSKMYSAMDELLGITTPQAKSLKITAGNSLAHASPALFDNNVHRSITEVIPMYLSKILTQNTKLASMYAKKNPRIKVDEVSDLVYDYDNRRLTTSKDLLQKLEKDYLTPSREKGKAKTVASTIASSAVTELSRDKTLNKTDIALIQNNQSLLEGYISKASSIQGLSVDYKTLIEDAATGNIKNNELKAIVESNDKLKAVINALAKGRKEERVKDLNLKLSDIRNKYPITEITRLIEITSQILQRKVKNTVSNEEAQILAQGFIDFIGTKQSGISASDILSAEAFRLIPEKHADKIMDVIRVFISEIKEIIESRDMYKTSLLDYHIGLVNRELTASADTNIGTFQTLSDLSPDVYRVLSEKSSITGATRQLTASQLVEGRFDNRGEIELISRDKLRAIARTPKKQATEIKDKRAVESLVTGAAEFLQSKKEDYKATQGNPIQILKRMIIDSKELSSTVRANVKKAYDRVSSSTDELKNSFNNLTDQAIDKSLGVIIDKLNKTIENTSALIKSEQAAVDTEISELENLRKNAESITNDQTTMQQIDKDINSAQKLHKASSTMMIKYNNILTAQRDKLLRLRDSQTEDRVKLLNSIRETITSTLDSMKALVSSPKEKTSATA